jgi:hypothetical protein
MTRCLEPGTDTGIAIFAIVGVAIFQSPEDRTRDIFCAAAKAITVQIVTLGQAAYAIIIFELTRALV